MPDPITESTPELGHAPSVTYNHLFHKFGLIFCSEGVPIFPVVLSGSQNSRRTDSPASRLSFRHMTKMMALILVFFAVSAFAQQDNTIVSIRVIGNRRIPKETILARLFTHPGDTFDPLAIERDFNSLWNTGYFEDVRIEREDTPKGVILNVFVREKPTIREINYKGLNSVTQSDVLDRFKKEKVGLTVESQYDPTKVKRAETVLKELLAEHGHQFATIKTDVKTIPPASVAVNFNIKEGPTVKVGKIQFTGNEHISSRDPARFHEEPEADRHSALHLSRKPACPEPTTPASWKKTPSASARLTATRATSAPRWRSRLPISATKAACRCSLSAPRRASASTSACRLKKAIATASAPSPSPATPR